MGVYVWKNNGSEADRPGSPRMDGMGWGPGDWYLEEATERLLLLLLQAGVMRALEWK
jgi:hypothetical protein